ncbi:hypothetical protein DI09_311p10, partial [Mitosporidium daphniae]
MKLYTLVPLFLTVSLLLVKESYSLIPFLLSAATPSVVNMVENLVKPANSRSPQDPQQQKSMQYTASNVQEREAANSYVPFYPPGYMYPNPNPNPNLFLQPKFISGSMYPNPNP